ncbi:FimV domain-containing protein [Massilia sp. Root133]|uniref:Response regulator n=1 Tax=Massilia cellulosiltytica TaxID=2683234 RepID=A0A7X3FVJ4_9BURK|nr:MULTISPECIES: tetratricopeptide repeat-containing response regulator [Telluria group]KQY00386.1 FimV domain-containing protein [Massilia sp. Root133]MVW58751.1 response regulator [Telluria cellulosilytica]
MNELDGLNALIIEPHAGMRSTIHNMLNMCGLSKIDHVGSSNQAVKHLGLKQYDLILCEYALEGGQDGQQLLEDVRHHKLMPLSTMFFMVTAEGDYGKVVSAAELGPTDYVLKPFTADRLLERIARGLERRNALLPVYDLMEAGNQREAIAACLDGEERYPRYLVDFMRLRAELHMFLGEPHEAEPLYRQLVETKAIAWARLGLAKTLFLRERYDEAREMLEDLVDANKNFVDAYDWLARTHEAAGALDAAQAVLTEAVTVSPHAVRRLRKLGETALEAGDHDTAEKILKQVVSKAKYSEFKDPQDHVRLVQTLVRKGDPVQAAAVIRDLDKSMAFQKHTPLCSAIASSLVHEYTGNEARLAESLAAALAASQDAPDLRPEIKLELARTCIENGMEEGAAEIVRDVMRNAQNGAAVARAMAVFENAGQAETAQKLAMESRQQVVDLVATGAAKAKSGDYKGAVVLMQEAATKLPDNPQVVFNAALAILKCLDHEGWDERLGQQALAYIAGVRRLDPVNPKLPALAGLHHQILKKYDKGPRPKRAG